MLLGKRVKLKPLEKEDIEMTREWRNRYRDKFFDASYITKDQQRQWYEKFRETGDLFFIVLDENETPIGTISLYNINLGDKAAVLGRVILLDEFRGHGYGEEAVHVVLGLAEKMGLHKVKVEVHLENIDAIAIYARAGFKTQTKPIIYMEKFFDSNKDKKILSYEDLSEDMGFESQCSNVKGD